MWKRVLTAAAMILIAWTALDLLLHRLFLSRMYAENTALWRPLSQMNIPLIYLVTLILIAVFVAGYLLLVRPKSLRMGLAFGALLGLGLSISAGFGTYIHTPIPLALAWGWFIGGWLKGLIAGAIMGRLITPAIDPLGR